MFHLVSLVSIQGTDLTVSATNLVTQMETKAIPIRTLIHKVTHRVTEDSHVVVVHQMVVHWIMIGATPVVTGILTAAATVLMCDSQMLTPVF